MVSAIKLCANGVACVTIALVFCVNIWSMWTLVMSIGDYFNTHANPWVNEDIFSDFFLPTALLLVIGVCQVSMIYGACREIYLFYKKPRVQDPERQAILDPSNSAANLPPYDGTKAPEKEGINY